MNYIYSTYKRAFRWSFLSFLMRSRFAQIASLLPIVGYLVLFSRGAHEYLDGSVFFGDFMITGIQKVLFIYFGSLFLFLSFIIYSVFCPKVIKKHHDYEDYVIEMEVSGAKEIRKKLIVHNFALFFHGNGTMRIPCKAGRYLQERRGSAARARTLYNRLNNKVSSSRSTFILHYIHLEDRNFIALNTSASFFAIGVLLYTVPSIDALFQAFQAAIALLLAVASNPIS